MTASYSVLHLLVDGMCALAMFARFLPGGNGHLYILLYNFCAFALQMPLGVALDALWAKEEGRLWDFPFLFAAAGVFCTILGALTHPVVLGIGNALFHVGGGVGTIREDAARGFQGRGLGIFVAPGALGLYLGTMSAGSVSWKACFWGTAFIATAICAWAARGARTRSAEARNLSRADDGFREQGGKAAKGIAAAAICCLAVVMLRSYVGLAVVFPWKSGILAGMLAVLAVAGGKMAGGFAAARYGFVKTTLISLGLAAFGYLFSSVGFMGLAALFLYNMTMPMTLYWMICVLPRMPGFAFGFLTFALFLGFLPVYFAAPAGGNLTGCAASLLTALLLAAGYVGCGSGFPRRRPGRGMR